MITRKKCWRIARLMGFGTAACVAGVMIVACWPMPFSYTAPKFSPPAGYAEAKALIEAKIAKAPVTLSEAGRPRVFLHDAPTEHVFVLLHGLTNSPEQFDKLGRILFERGHNVVIPRTPGHGDANLMTDALSVFTAKAMLDYANLAITLARPLGRRLTVVGLSINGTTAAWVAQNRSDVDRAVLLAPFLAPGGLPQWANRPLSQLLIRMPNIFLWWDPVHKDQLSGSSHAYPRFSTRSIGETMRLGVEVFGEAESSPPACGSIMIVTSASDIAANNVVTARLASHWQKLRPGVVQSYEFPASEKVPHDFIDPAQSDQRVDIVYPRLIEMLETGKTPGGL
jgi:pimeloyl-ACP methyl ester carboxylesterase